MITVDVHQRDCYDDLVHKKARARQTTSLTLTPALTPTPDS